jgi:hypothetical protein
MKTLKAPEENGDKRMGIGKRNIGKLRNVYKWILGIVGNAPDGTVHKQAIRNL